MHDLIVSAFMTLDGVMEAPGGEPTHPHTGWAGEFMSAEAQDYKFREVLDAGTLLIGRTTYESFAGAWPGYEGPFADRMNSMEKVVVSSTLTEPEWANTRVLDGDVIAGVRALKELDGDPVLVNGSATLVHTLLAEGLVDELRLMVVPLSIGDGLRLFPAERNRFEWDPVETVRFSDSGARIDVYRLPPTVD